MKSQHLNFDQQYVPRKVTYYDKTIRMDKNPIKTVFNVCDKLIENRVSRQQNAITSPHPPIPSLTLRVQAKDILWLASFQ